MNPAAQGTSARSLEGLVDLILDMAALTDADALIARALKKLQATFPHAVSGAHLVLEGTGEPRIHPASWSREGDQPLAAVRKDALSQFSLTGGSLLVTNVSPGPASVRTAPGPRGASGRPGSPPGSARGRRPGERGVRPG